MPRTPIASQPSRGPRPLLELLEKGPFGVEARRGGEGVEYLPTRNPMHQDALVVPARQLPGIDQAPDEIDGAQLIQQVRIEGDLRGPGSGSRARYAA